jgi:hypothetical protein
MVVRFTALEAGARLGDAKAVEPLRTIAIKNEDGLRDRATAMLGKLVLQHPENRRLVRTLREQLDDDDAFVRFAAFDALARIEDSSIVTRRFGDRFELAMVRSSRPMIYVTRQEAPRIVVFNQMLGFEPGMLFTEGDNALMLAMDDGEQRLRVRYRPPEESLGKTYRIPATVGNLIYLLANQPTPDDPSPGFGMRYSRVVRIVHELTEAGHVDAPFVLQSTDLLQRLAQQHQSRARQGGRPETDRSAVDGREDVQEGPRPESQTPREKRSGRIVPLEESGDNWLQ